MVTLCTMTITNFKTKSHTPTSFLIVLSRCLTNIIKLISKTELVITLNMAPISVKITSTHTIAEARRLQVILGFPVSFSSHLQSLCSDHQVLQICHKAYLMFSLHLAARVRLLISKPDITSLLKTFGRLPIAPRKNFTASQTLYGVTTQQPLGTYSAILLLAPHTAAMREFPCFQGYLKLLLLACTL